MCKKRAVNLTAFFLPVTMHLIFRYSRAFRVSKEVNPETEHQSLSETAQIERKRSNRKEHGLIKVLVSFLGSMEVAITLFVIVGIASIIGTILQQNQDYNSYIIKFGPFWFEVFRSLELFDIYSAWWFVILLGFLLISTSVCIYHYAPVMFKEWRRYRLNVSAKSLRLMHASGCWKTSLHADEILPFIQSRLKNGGYQSKLQTEQSVTTIAAKKGAASRLGYIFTHSAIIIICLSALYDGSFNLKLREMMGQLKPETRDIFASKIPEISRLKANENHAFRGNVNIPEGRSADMIFLRMRNGFLVQELPFTLKLNDFRIEHYESGQPKSFESDVVIQDKKTGEIISKTIEVNHPLVYKDFAIYQSSFEDGGSVMKLQAWSLGQKQQQMMAFEQIVGDDKTIALNDETYKLELTEFKVFNIQPNPDAETTGRQFKNMGPSLGYKIRDSAGQAKEFLNYMSPQEQEGRYFFLSGIRSATSEPFRYLFIPADDSMSLKRFFTIRDLLNDSDELQRIALKTAALSLENFEGTDATMQQQMAVVMQRLAESFSLGGFNQVLEDINKNVPEDKREMVRESYFKVLQTILGTVYLEALKMEGVDISKDITPAQEQYYDDMVNTMGILPLYQAPFFVKLNAFEHKEASGFQITKAPGKELVYLGCILLCIGIVLMFYVAHKRIWIIISQKEGGQQEILVAGTGDRHQKEFAREFQAFSQILDNKFSQ
jgi:cytochrome c biogenesis protein